MTTGLEPGSLTELIVGVSGLAVALVLGLMAWSQSRKSNSWAKRAATAQEEANELAEAALNPKLRAEFMRSPEATGLDDDRIRLYLASEAPSIYLIRVETTTRFGEPSQVLIVDENRTMHGPLRIAGGESVDLLNPFDRRERAPAIALLYSMIPNGRQRQTLVSLNEMPGVVVKEERWLHLGRIRSRVVVRNQTRSPISIDAWGHRDEAGFGFFHQQRIGLPVPSGSSVTLTNPDSEADDHDLLHHAPMRAWVELGTGQTVYGEWHEPPASD